MARACWLSVTLKNRNEKLSLAVRRICVRSTQHRRVILHESTVTLCPPSRTLAATHPACYILEKVKFDFWGANFAQCSIETKLGCLACILVHRTEVQGSYMIIDSWHIPASQRPGAGNIIIIARSMIRPMIAGLSLGECRSERGRTVEEFLAVLPRGPTRYARASVRANMVSGAWALGAFPSRRMKAYPSHWDFRR